MSSTHRSQLRLHQITGSLNSAQGTSSSLNAPSMQLVLDHLASGMKNITGQDFHNTSRGTLKDYAGNTRIKYQQGQNIIFYESDGSTAAMSIHESTGAVTIAGDLTVNGTTTTIDTTTLTVEDALITLGRGNANVDQDLGGSPYGADLGLILERPSQQASVVLNLTDDISLKKAAGSAGNGGTFKLVVNAAANNGSGDLEAVFSGSASAVVLTITPKDATGSGPYNMTGAQLVELLNSGTVAALSGNITVTDGSSLRAGMGITAALVAGSGATNLANGSEDDDRVQTFSGGKDGNIGLVYSEEHDVLILGSTAENADAAAEQIAFTSYDDDHGGGLRVGRLQLSSANDHIGLDGSGNLKFEALNDMEFLAKGGQISLKDDNAAVELQFFDAQGGSAESVGLKAPDDLAASIDFTLPAARPSAGQVQAMVSNDAGILSFQDVPTTADITKSVITINGKITADDTNGGAASYDPAFSLGMPAGSINENNEDILDSRSMIYVNGQLLVSGSATEVTNGSADYKFIQVPSEANQPKQKLKLLDSSDHNIGTMTQNDTIIISAWQSLDYVAATRNGGGSMELKSKTAVGVLHFREPGQTADVAPELEVGDIVLISGIYGRVSALDTSTNDSVANGKATITKIGGAAFSGSELDALAAGNEVKLAAKRVPIKILAQGVANAGNDANGSYHSSHGTTLRPGIAVNTAGLANAAAGTAKLVEDKIKDAVNTAGTANPDLGLSATADADFVYIHLANVFDNRANGTLSATSDTTNILLQDSSKLQDVTQSGAHSLKFAFDLESNDVVVIKTS